MRRRKSSGKSPVLNPRRDCPDCKGYGWVPIAGTPTVMREVTGVKDRVEMPTPVVRCGCTKPKAEKPGGDGLDAQSRAAGEQTS